MMEKAYSLFLCTLLISVLFLPSTAAATRILLHTAQTENEGGYHGKDGGSKIDIHPSPSPIAPSRTGVSSPSKPTPVQNINYILFLPSTAAERALLQTAETEGEGRNDGNKIGVTPSRSKPAPSRTEFPSPSKPTPVWPITYGSKKPAVPCRGIRYTGCLAGHKPQPKARCSLYERHCR